MTTVDSSKGFNCRCQFIVVDSLTELFIVDRRTWHTVWRICRERASPTRRTRPCVGPALPSGNTVVHSPVFHFTCVMPRPASLTAWVCLSHLMMIFAHSCSWLSHRQLDVSRVLSADFLWQRCTISLIAIAGVLWCSRSVVDCLVGNNRAPSPHSDHFVYLFSCSLVRSAA